MEFTSSKGVPLHVPTARLRPDARLQKLWIIVRRRAHKKSNECLHTASFTYLISQMLTINSTSKSLSLDTNDTLLFHRQSFGRLYRQSQSEGVVLFLVLLAAVHRKSGDTIKSYLPQCPAKKRRVWLARSVFVASPQVMKTLPASLPQVMDKLSTAIEIIILIAFYQLFKCWGRLRHGFF